MQGRMISCSLVRFVVALAGIVVVGASPDPVPSLTRIAFGSCNKHNRPQPLWPEVAKRDPQLWVWLGDVVYLDSFKVLPFFPKATPVEGMRSRYTKQLALPGYANFVSQMKRSDYGIIGVWDDHDFGINDGNAKFAGRHDTQQLFLDFLGISETDPLRKRDGVYSAHSYGPSHQKVKVILLDIRSHQQPVQKDGSADLLGAEQWQWLEKELLGDDDPAMLTLIGSGIQVVSTNKMVVEGWKQFPRSRRRLYRLLAKFTSQANARKPGSGGVLMLSGDVHLGEISKSFYCNEDHSVIYPLYDITSSGMTHAWGKLFPFANSIYERASHAKRIGASYLDINFGSITIDWASDPIINVGIHGRDGVAHINVSIPLRHLTTPLQRSSPSAHPITLHSQPNSQATSWGSPDEQWQDVLAHCQETSELHFGTRGHYFQGIIVAQWASIVALGIGGPVVCLLLRTCCRLRGTKAKDS